MPRDIIRIGRLRLDLDGVDEAWPSTAVGQAKLLHRWGLSTSPVEALWVIAYDLNASIRTVVEVARGDLRAVSGHMPSLLGAVLTSGCERFMISHNHPAGVVVPSQGDIQLTLEVKNAANTCGLWFEDHLITGPRGEMFSFRDNGLLFAEDYARSEHHQMG